LLFRVLVCLPILLYPYLVRGGQRGSKAPPLALTNY
jgi:hypothetical protein